MCRRVTYCNHAQGLTTGTVQLQHQELPPPAVRSWPSNTTQGTFVDSRGNLNCFEGGWQCSEND